MSDPQILTDALTLLEWPRLCDHLSTFASTKIGSLACLHLNPWFSHSESEQRLQETEEAIHLDLITPGGLALNGIYDLIPYVERAERGGILQGLELAHIASTLAAARKLRRLLDETERVPTLQAILSSIRTYPEVEQDIYRCLDDQGDVRDAASDTLAHLRGRIRDVRGQIQSGLQRLMSERSVAIQEPLITQRDGRYVIPVKATHRDVIRGLVHDSSGSGATLYLEPYSVVPLNNQTRQLQGQARAEEERIRQGLSQQVGAVTADLRHLQEAVVWVDLALARARYSLWLQGNRPVFTDERPLSLRQVRHPLLLWQTQHEPGSVVPIDFTLPSEVTVVVITGPNTGGKTVALKTLGLLVLMAKAGIYLPAREPVELPWLDGVFADIGDEQSLQQSLSTFSGHIRRIQRIREQVNARALVLLDEVGAGTDPSEGAALAAALLHDFAQQARLTVATTHYGELKALKYQSPLFENASVEFDEVTLAPLYRLRWGIPGRSNALAIAQRLGLDPEVLNEARQHLQGSDRVNEVIIGLERQRTQFDQRLAHVEALHRELEGLQQEMQKRHQNLLHREEALRQQQGQAVQETIQSARDKIAGVIRRLQQGDPTAQDARQATQSLHAIAEEYLPPPPPPIEYEFFPQVGDRIRLPGLGQTGEISAIDGNTFSVRSGILKFSVALNQIAPLDDHQAKQRQRPKAKPVPPSVESPPLQIRTSRNTFDLRGKTVAEGSDLLDGALIEADGPIWVIHGHGTGKLRAGIHQYLKHHPRVQSFAFAPQEDGGTGVTVVQVKS